MPSTHTHALIAEEVLAALPENVRAQIVSEKEYFAGAQGADVYFFLRFCADTEKNVGKSLHRRGIYKSFSALLDAAREGDAAVRSYAGTNSTSSAEMSLAPKETSSASPPTPVMRRMRFSPANWR